MNSPALSLLKQILQEISLPTGSAAVEKFASLREVDAKIREAKHVFASVDGLPRTFTEELCADPDFQMQSRRVRLEALAGYVRSAIKFCRIGSAHPTGEGYPSLPGCIQDDGADANIENHH